jgi:predicted nucleic acid-binding protein
MHKQLPPPERSDKVILVDTSIWIDHFRCGDSELRKIIEDDRLLCHPAIIGELALGSLRDRDAVMP